MDWQNRWQFFALVSKLQFFYRTALVRSCVFYMQIWGNWKSSLKCLRRQPDSLKSGQTPILRNFTTNPSKGVRFSYANIFWVLSLWKVIICRLPTNLMYKYAPFRGFFCTNKPFYASNITKNPNKNYIRKKMFG